MYLNAHDKSVTFKTLPGLTMPSTKPIPTHEQLIIALDVPQRERGLSSFFSDLPQFFCCCCFAFIISICKS